MRSNYRRIGDFIQLVDERNRDLEVKTLLGLTINKQFIPSVANIIGTDMASYKIIRKNQFACSLMQVRRDKKMPVALLKDIEEAIISQAYPVFEIKDTRELLPEYLMMWMTRSEFDREACFYAVGGVRGSLEWEDFCNMELPVPSPEKQQEIVNEYNTVVNRIRLNEELNQKLEETVQTLYRHWFVDFEFPISKEYAEAVGKPELEGKPYKSSGGEMVYNEGLEGEIPKDWLLTPMGDLVESYSRKHDFKKDKIIFFNTSDILNGEFLHSNYSDVITLPGQAKKRIQKDDILYSEIRPINRRFAWVRISNAEDFVVSTKLMVLRKKTDLVAVERIYHYLTSEEVLKELQYAAEGRSGTFPQITFEEHIETRKLLLGTQAIEYLWQNFLENFYSQWFSKKDENKILQELRSLLLANLTKVDNLQYEDEKR